MTSSPRGRRPITAALGLLTLLSAAACGAAGPHPAVSATSSKPSTSTEALAANNSTEAAGRATLTEAIAATEALRSYSFSSVETVGAARTTSSTLTGRAVRPSSVSYLLRANGKQTQIVRLPAGTYLRVANGRWSRLKHPAPAVDPVASLVTLLRAISRPTVSAGPSGSTSLQGSIPARTARTAGLAEGGGDAAVTVAFDPQHRVTSIAVSTVVSRTGSRKVHVALITRYGAFNGGLPLTAPA